MKECSDGGISRREALVTTAAGAAAVVVAGGLGGCSLTRHDDKPPMITSGIVNIGPARDFPAGTANTRFVDMYGIVIANASGEPLAIRPKCTHMGCIAKWQDQYHEFVCPCHGSRYDLVGRVTKGPAKRPLPAIFAERQPDDTLTVNLTKLYAL